MAHFCRRIATLATSMHRTFPAPLNNYRWNSSNIPTDPPSAVDKGADGSAETSSSGQASSTPTAPQLGKDMLVDLRDRGLCATESFEAQATFLSGEPIVVYAGFDPTADSLHIGHALMLLTLLRFHEAGHTIIALVGGATAMVGDPSDQTQDRVPLGQFEVECNTHTLIKWITDFFEKNRRNSARIEVVNNADWYKDMNLLHFFAKYGSQLRVTTLLGREFVQARLNGSGLSYKEFSYQMFQAIDYAMLHDKYSCNLQIGGQDQWGNILNGIEMVRKLTGQSVHGLTLPLLTTPHGQKIAKSAGNSVWLDANKTTPFQLYQYIISLDHSCMDQYLNALSFLPVKDIRQLLRKVRVTPTKETTGMCQRLLAKEIVSLVHGEADLEVALAATAVLYGRTWNAKAASQLSEEALEMLSKEVPFSRFPRLMRKRGDIVKIVQKIKLCRGNPGLKHIIENFQTGKISCNGEVLSEVSELEDTEMLFGKYSFFRHGKRGMHLVEWTDAGSTDTEADGDTAKSDHEEGKLPAADDQQDK